MNIRLVLFVLTVAAFGCAKESTRKGFSVNDSSPEETELNKTGLQSDSISFATRPNGILLTSDSVHRLIPIYKLNFKEERNSKIYYTGSNSFHSNYRRYGESEGNNWHRNFMPGFEAMYGFNLVNVEYHNISTKQTTPFFNKPVLIKTFYYPTFSKDTLNGKAIKRNYHMVSAYDEDTNGDGFLNTDDLRRFFLFDVNGVFLADLVPQDHSVKSSQYDPANDYMYVYAVQDENGNGGIEPTEPVHVFWIHLNNPSHRGKMY